MKTDTVYIGPIGKIIISYPEISYVDNINYEEGFIRTITFEDTAFVVIHFGSNAIINVVDKRVNPQEINISSEYVIANDFRQTRGFYYLNGEKKYFREDIFYKYGIKF